MKKVLVIGAAISGIAVSKYLNEKGYEVFLTDSRQLEEKEELEALGIRVADGGHPDWLLDNDYEFVVKNPGIRYNVPFVAKIVEKGLPILNEMEIALNDHPEVRYGAVTGTNGKTTTTMMLGGMLKQLNPSNGPVGNMGIALCDVLDNNTDPNLTVAIEIAGLQLLGCPSFHPQVSVIMNLTPDHLDYFGTLDNYYRSKTLIYKNQGKDDYFIKNVDDENIMAYCQDVPCNVITFSLVREDTDLHLKDGTAWFRDIPLFDLDKFFLPGMHNVENAMISGCMAYLLGVTPEYIRYFLENFKGVEHRIEYVETINGARYYNDSKGTNVDSTIMALKSFSQPVHLLVGGYDKKTGFDGLKPYVGNVRQMYAFGDTKQQFADLFDNVVLFDNMEQALNAAYKNAGEGEVVLLSPACASWDQFPNYEVRGRMFKDMVRKLAESK